MPRLHAGVVLLHIDLEIRDLSVCRDRSLCLLAPHRLPLYADCYALPLLCNVLMVPRRMWMGASLTSVMLYQH